LIEKYLGSQPSEEFYREYPNYGKRGQVNELQWARMQLNEVDIKVDETDFLPPGKSSSCTLM